jgi:chemotaxis protein histidine kinase CheA
MSTDKQVILTFTADATGLNQSLTAINSQLSGVADTGAKAGKGISDGLKTADKTLNQTSSNAMRMAGALSAISPEAAGLASGLGKLAIAAEVATLAQGALAGGITAVGVAVKATTVAMLTNPVFLGLTAGIALMTAAYKQFSSELENAEKKTNAQATATERATKIHKAFSDLLDDVAKKNSIATGTTTALREAQKQEEEQLNANYQAQSKGLRQSIAEDAKFFRTSEEKEEQLMALFLRHKDAISQSRETLRIEEAKEKATKGSTGATKDNTEALKKQADEEEERNAVARRATERAEAAMARQDEHREKSGKKAKRLAEEKAQQEKDDAAEAIRLANEVAAAKIAALRDQLSAAQSIAGSLSGLATQLNDQAMANLNTTTRGGKRAALEQWQSNQAAAVAMATVQSGLGVAMAAASAPPPLNVPSIVAATVAGLASIASIAASPPPKFHAGATMVGGRPDELNATLRKGEAVLSSEGVNSAGRDMVGRWNSGRSAGAPPPLVMQYRHQIFNRFIRDNLRMSTPLSAAVSTGSAPGFRDRG